VTAGREDWRAGALGQLRTSHADREQAIDVLKAAFVQGRLTKDEFDLRIGHVFASRTYTELGALTADIPGWVTGTQPPAEPAREPGRVLSFKTAARVGAVGAGPSVASAASVMMHSSGVPAVAGVLLVGLTGVFVAGLLTALLMFVSWVVRRSRRGSAQGPPSGPAGLASKRQTPARQLPARHGSWDVAETARSRLARMRVSPVQGRGDVLAVDSCLFGRKPSLHGLSNRTRNRSVSRAHPRLQITVRACRLCHPRSRQALQTADSARPAPARAGRLGHIQISRYWTDAVAPPSGSPPADPRGLRLFAGFRHAV
jgi:hypothetical protein